MLNAERLMQAADIRSARITAEKPEIGELAFSLTRSAFSIPEN